MKILVTGEAGFRETGFIGSAVARHAVRAGYGVVNLDALRHAASLDNAAALANSPLYVFDHADIRARAALDRIFAAHTPNATLHLAAESSVDRALDGPGAFIETNITGTCKLPEAARAYRIAQGIWNTRHGGARCIPERALDEGCGWLAETMASLTLKQKTFA